MTADDVPELLTRALAERGDAPAVRDRLREHRERLDQPVRLAVAGRVKAGKSTLLNALVGEVVAPTDAGECTRVVTWYRHATTPSVTLHATDGGRRSLPARRSEGQLRLDLAGTPVEEVDRLVVDWPAARLSGLTLVDTPGISSLSPSAAGRTGELVTPERGAVSGADALLFLTRQVHAEDAAFLRRFQADLGGAGGRASTLTVLSRADEVGSARVDALRSAQRVAQRTAGEPALQALSSAVLPVAGLVALAGRTLRHAELLALRTLAALPPAELESLLISADRFVRPGTTTAVPPDVRQRLVARFGLFGVRLAASLVREGATDSATLAAELVRRSGLAELERLLDVQVRTRAAQLRARSALEAVEWALREAPRAGDAPLWASLERVRTAGHDLAELDLLARVGPARSPLATLPQQETARLLGGTGTTPAARLGLPADTPDAELAAAAHAALAEWQDRAGDPLAPRATTDAAAVVVRSLEGLLAELGGSAPGGAHRAAEPGPDGAGGQQQRAGERQRAHGQQRPAVDVGATGDDAGHDQGDRDGGERDERDAPAGPRLPAQQQRQAGAADDDEHPDRRQRRHQRDGDALPQQVTGRLRVLRRGVGGQPGA